ncbi:hypothetical protein HYW82_01865, partial [Candidatus Peregrinibacteria bacterium]|nr:hypothetical protein [Candidatus Peregrinibacteria bacterium]
TVKDGETKTLVLRLDVGDGAATTKAGFEIASKEKVEITGADVSGTFPAQGDEFNLATDEVGTLTVEKNGTLTNPKVGEDGVTIAKFKMTTSGEGAVISRLGLLLTGTVSVNDAQNFKLYVSGTTDPIAEVAAVDSNDLINFTMPDAGYTIAKGDSKSFYINADFNTGRSSDSVKVYIDQDTDVVTTGDKYGFGLAITRTLYDGNPDACLNGSSNDCSYSSLQGGDITITTSGPAATNIAKNGKDVSLMEFSITSVSEVTFKKFPLSLTATEADATEGLMNATASNFTDIKITNVDTGKETFTAVDAGVFKTTIGGATAITEAAGDNAEAYHIFTDNVTIAAGETLNLKLTVDIANTDTLDGMTLIAQLPLGDSTSYPEVRDVNNKVLTNSSSLTPAADITAKTMTVKVPSLTLSLGSTPVVNGSNYVKGAKGVPFTGIVFACGDASSCKVTDVSLVGTVDETGATTAAATFPTTATNPGLDGAIQVNSIVGSVWLEDIDGNIVAAAKSVAANSGAVTFTNVNWTISAGSSPVLYVKGDISASAFKSSDADAVAFKVTAASSVTAEDKDGNSITPTGTVNHPSVTTASTWVVVLGGGSLTVAVDADTAQEDIILAGSTGVEVSKFKFTTTNEAFKVKALAINNRQSGATTATLGDYDNNVKQVTLSYTNSAGAAESKTASLVSGTANFSGLDFYIGKDNSAVITVKADTNTISSGSATAGEYVDMNLGFNNFEAIAQSSGETYKGDKIDATVSADSDLDFGTITWTDGTNIDINTAADIATATAGGTVTLTVNDETDGNPPNLPVGTLLCQDSSTTCSGKAVFVVTAWTEGSTFTDAGNTGDSITAIVLDNADTAVADADNLVYSLPGSGYLTSANRLHVYETRPTLALAAASPSGSRSTSSSDDAFVFTVNANVLEQVNLRAGTELTGTMLDGVGTPCAISTVTAAGLQVDGSAQLCTLDALAAGDSFSFATTAMTDYDRISFWINVVDTAGGTDSAFADYKVSTGTAQATFTAGTATALSQTICGADQATLTTAEWYFCDTQLPKDAGTLTHVHFEFDETTELADTDLVYIDEIWLYNDKIKIDIATDADLDTYANNATNAGSPVAVLLKEGSTTKATGYVTTTTNGASATSTGSITFIPTTQIEVAKNTTKTLTVNLNSGDLINEDTGSDDPVTFSIALGSSLEGTVTSGGFWWNDTNVDLDKNGTTTAAELTASAIKWVGKVSSTTLTGNTVKY